MQSIDTESGRNIFFLLTKNLCWNGHQGAISNFSTFKLPTEDNFKLFKVIKYVM